MLDYSDYVTVKMIKVKDELGRFSHWESETSFSRDWHKYKANSPVFYETLDEAVSHIKAVAQYWTIGETNENS